jgi:branched-chain amino acid transport system ATP-binding protein
MSQNKCLQVNDLSIAFGGIKAIDHLSFSVDQGEIYGLIGPNGAGKTTVFNCITQFYSPDQGEILFNNRRGDQVDLNEKVTHQIIHEGLVRSFQNIELIKDMSLLDNLLVGAHISYDTGILATGFRTRKAKREEAVQREKAMGILKFLKIDHKAHETIGGQPYGILKKVELGRTLMSDPKLILLDEPAAGLNDSETRDMSGLLKEIRDSYGCTILLVEHDMNLVMDVCDRICAISFGKKLGEGTGQEIQQNKAVQEAYLGKGDA